MKLKSLLLVMTTALLIAGCNFDSGKSSSSVIRPTSTSASSTSNNQSTALPSSSSENSSTDPVITTSVDQTTSLLTTIPTSTPTSENTSESTHVTTSDVTSVPTSTSASEITSTLTSMPTSEPTSITSNEPTSIITSTPTSIPTSEPTSLTPSSSETSETSLTSGPGFELDSIPVNFTAINDFHGQLDEDGYQVGIAKMTTYLKDRKNEGDILISSGDNYQGSLICNYDKGEFVSSVFKDIGFDAYTIGNHEFDWGIAAIYKNEKRLGQRFLGANIYQYPKGDEWVKADLGQNYNIVTLYEGTPYETKVGIIGVIGRSQITSITSTFVSDYIFLDPEPIVKQLAIELREEQGCDVVVASYHDGYPDTSIANTVPGKDYRYVDACFLGHTHDFYYEKVNNVPFIQGGDYSRGVSSAKLSFNKLTGNVSLEKGEYVYLSEQDLEPDEEVDQQLDNIKDSLHDKFYKTVGINASGNEINVYDMSRFYAKISYERAIYNGYSPIACMFNYSRRPLKEGYFTYSDLFETHPFLNDIYIISVSEYDILRERNYSCGYGDHDYDFPSSRYVFHDVVVFNYNGFHIGLNSDNEKYYNYFPSAFTSSAEHEPIKLDFNCFDLALEWLQENDITTADFSGAGFFGQS